MKDTNGKTITEEEFMKDIGHGVERTQENWKEEMYKIWMSISEITEIQVKVENLVESLLAEERNKVLSEVEREVEKKLLEKARQTDYADRTEYDEASEIVSTIISNLRVK